MSVGRFCVVAIVLLLSALGVCHSADTPAGRARVLPVLRVAGRVVDQSGEPVPNAGLFCEAVSLVEQRELPVVEGRSGTDGSFTLSTPPGTSFSGNLWVNASGYALEFPESYEFAASDEPREVTKII